MCVYVCVCVCVCACACVRVVVYGQEYMCARVQVAMIHVMPGSTCLCLHQLIGGVLSLFASGCFPSGEISQAKYIVHDVP